MSIDSKRMKRLREYSHVSPYANLIRQVGPRGLQFVMEFIILNDHLDKSAFAEKVNRMFLDQKDKPANWAILDQLLTNVNSALPDPKKGGSDANA